MLEINNFTTSQVDEKFLQKVAQRVLEGEGIKKAEISLAIIGGGRMRSFNKKYRGKNRITDVLSFGENLKHSHAFVMPPDNMVRLGEVVICLPQAKKQAKKQGHSLERELSFLLIHGVLHLLGYDHEKMGERKIMFARQDKILREIG